MPTRHSQLPPSCCCVEARACICMYEAGLMASEALSIPLKRGAATRIELTGEQVGNVPSSTALNTDACCALLSSTAKVASFSLVAPMELSWTPSKTIST